jgi:hypothetical protein
MRRVLGHPKKKANKKKVVGSNKNLKKSSKKDF